MDYAGQQGDGMAPISSSALKIEQLEEGSQAELAMLSVWQMTYRNGLQRDGIAKTLLYRSRARLEGSIASYPLSDDGYDHDACIAGRLCHHRSGTGFVHIAPGHGPEDYQPPICAWQALDTVGEDGVIAEHLPLFGGCHVLRDNQKIADVMAEKGGLIGIGTLVTLSVTMRFSL